MCFGYTTRLSPWGGGGNFLVQIKGGGGRHPVGPTDHWYQEVLAPTLWSDVCVSWCWLILGAWFSCVVVVLAAVVVAEILQACPFVELDPVGLQDGLQKKQK
jgi:hypothetical protein